MNCHVDLAIANAPQQVKPVLRHDTADVPKLLLSRPLSHIIYLTPKKVGKSNRLTRYRIERGLKWPPPEHDAIVKRR